MRVTSLVPLWQAFLVHYAAERAKHMVDERYELIVTELGAQIMREQMPLDA